MATFSYDPELPAALDRMRFVLGDTVVSPSTSALLPDETYDAMSALYGETQAVAVLARGLATKFAQQPTSIGSDGDTFNWSDRVKTWLAIADRYDAGAAGGTGSTWQVGSFLLDYLEPAEAEA